MKRRNRVARPKGELQAELKSQLALLLHACESFDRGFEAIAKHIALTLRVLLHQHGHSRALLEQLGMRNGRFYDTAGPINPRNLLSQCNLVVLASRSGSPSSYEPLVAAGGGPFAPKRIPFVNWWNDPVLKDNKSRMFSRRELITHVADTDGGAHVDPQLDEVYMALSRQNSLGWKFTDGTIERDFEGRPELACVRQIAHEVVMTLREMAPKYLEI